MSLFEAQGTHLLIIDPQNDFCDIPNAALPVAGADADMQRLAAFIQRMGARLDAIHVTLDSHNPMDIAHPGWWVDAAGSAPAPFTLITAAQVRDGAWRTRSPALQARSLAYVEALEAGGRYPLIIWPEHCLIGHWGHNVHAAVQGALDDWARAEMQVVNYVTKGTNPFTEHYSAIQAEVPDADDPATRVNAGLISALAKADRILVAGEALSHCVANTVRDIAAQLGEANIGKLTLLTDCASPVGGFEAAGQAFVAEMTARGMGVGVTAGFGG